MIAAENSQNTAASVNINVISEQEYQRIINSNTKVNATNFVVPKVYQEIFFNNYRYFLLSSGRLSGKTSILVGLWWFTINKYPDRDIIILQSTATEIKDSLINEIDAFLKRSGFDVGESPAQEWYIPRSKAYVQWSGQKGRTYFFPITDSKGGQRSRGIKTTNPISLVLYEECQKNKDANIVNQSVITFIRQLDMDAKLVIVGNSETAGHWFVDFSEEKRNDDEWCYIYANCFDIWELLNQQTRSYVLGVQKNNPIEFARVFLGDINASASDVVFPQFNRKKHYKHNYELEEHYITTLIIGIDHADADNAYVAVPVAILDNGTTQTLEVMYHDPKEANYSLALSEQLELLDEFLVFLDKKYGIVYNHLPTYLSVDCAATTFINQARHTKNTSPNRKLWSCIKIKSFAMKNKDVNLGIIKNAFAYNVLTILNEGAKTWDGKQNKHRLVHEIEAQRYKNHKLDKNIDNDFCDALEYGLIPYYSNCYNLSFPVRKAAYNASHVDDIRKLAGNNMRIKHIRQTA